MLLNLLFDKVKAEAITRLEQTTEYQYANPDFLAAQAEIDNSKPGYAGRKTAADKKLAAQVFLAKLRENALFKNPSTGTASGCNGGSQKGTRIEGSLEKMQRK
jgi:hypothetical protein